MRAIDSPKKRMIYYGGIGRQYFMNSRRNVHPCPLVQPLHPGYGTGFKDAFMSAFVGLVSTQALAYKKNVCAGGNISG